MFKHKKIVLAIFAIAMLCAMSTSVFAEEDIQNKIRNEEEIQQLVTRLEQGEGNIPIDFTLDDMNAFLEQADPDIVDEIMNKIFSNGIPMSTIEEELDPKQDAQRSNQYRTYDFSTKTEQILSFDDSDKNVSIQESEGSNIDSDTPTAYAYPDYWFEKSPQSYYDTRPTVDISIKLKDGRTGSCSGFLISNDTLVTAAHCIYISDVKDWCEYLIVYPSRSESSGDPYGYATSTNVIIGNYPDTGYRGDDWGAAKLSKSFSIGYLGMTTNTSNEKGREVRSQGYPAYLDSSGNPTDTQIDKLNNNLYLVSGKIVADGSAYLKYSDGTTYGGMSGGPVLYKNSNNTWVAGGITSGGNSSGKSIFCAFDNNLYNAIRSYI